MMQGVTVTVEELLALRGVASQISLRQRRTTYNAQQGNFQSPLRGRGMNFAETRIYQPGDDIRTINWAVTARTGKPHTKIYEQERDRPVYLIIDFNSSMFFGTRKAFKSVIAVQTAALIAWASLKKGDRIGALLLKDTFQLLPPRQRKQNLMELCKYLVKYVEPTHSCAVAYGAAFRQLRKTIRPGSLIYFISDFYNMGPILHNELQQLTRSHDITNILIYDLLEKEPPQAGRYLFYDPLQTSNIVLDTHSQTLCAQYRDIFHYRLTELKKLCANTGMHFIQLGTHDNILTTLFCSGG